MAPKPPDLIFLLKQHYFTIGIFFCIVLAEVFPFIGRQGGPLKPEITVKYFAVFIIFLTSGLTLNWNEFSQTIRQYRLHIFIQALAFIYIPIFIRIFLFAFEFVFELDSWVHKGLILVGCMPPPVSSAVILTKSIGGNEAAAIFNSAVGSILGIVITPILLFFHVGITSTIPVLKIVLQLIQTVIIPVLLGQTLQLLFSQSILQKIPFSVCSQMALLFIIYTSFCDMFLQEDFNVNAHVILMTIFLVVIIQIILMLSTFKISFLISKQNKIFTAQDIVTITLCSTHKSLTTGMPLLKTLYSGYSHLWKISLPLLIYHPVQLILGGVLVPYGKKWIKKYSISSSSFKRP